MNDKGVPENDKAFNQDNISEAKMAAARQSLDTAAELIGVHYKQLIAKGLPDTLARQLTTNFAEKFYEKVAS